MIPHIVDLSSLPLGSSTTLGVSPASSSPSPSCPGDFNLGWDLFAPPSGVQPWNPQNVFCLFSSRSVLRVSCISSFYSFVCFLCFHFDLYRCCDQSGHISLCSMDNMFNIPSTVCTVRTICTVCTACAYCTCCTYCTQHCTYCTYYIEHIVHTAHTVKAVTAAIQIKMEA